MGFCWRSLVTFCRYWQKVTRRRHVPYAKESTERKLPAGGTKEKLLTKSGPPETRSLCRRAYWKKVTVGDKRRTNCPTSALRTSLLPPHIKFLQILHISPVLSKFLDRKCQRPDIKSNIFDKMELIAFTVPQNPRKIAVSQTGTSLAITMGRRSTDRRIYVSLFE